jgi:hypothetical protein
MYMRTIDFLEMYNGKEIQGRKLLAYSNYIFDGYYRYHLYSTRSHGYNTNLPNNVELESWIEVVPWHGFNMDKLDLDYYINMPTESKDYNNVKSWVTKQHNEFDGIHMPLDFSKHCTRGLDYDIRMCFITGDNVIDQFKLSDETYGSFRYSDLVSGLKCRKLDLSNNKKVIRVLLEAHEIRFNWLIVSMSNIHLAISKICSFDIYNQLRYVFIDNSLID